MPLQRHDTPATYHPCIIGSRILCATGDDGAVQSQDQQASQMSEQVPGLETKHL